VSEIEAKPLITLITPVFRTDHDLLKACLLSCYNQTDQRFVHVVIDNGSDDPGISQILDEYSRMRPHIKVLSSDEPLGIAAGTNRALSVADTEYIAFLDHDDELTSDAVATCNSVLSVDPGIDVLYSDWDRIDVNGRTLATFRKPAWSPERLRGNMYLIHLLVIRRDFVERAGLLSDEFEGSQDHDLMLRVSELAPRVENVERSLYRWRAAPGSTVEDPDAKPYATENGKRAVEAHCERMGLNSEISHSESSGFYRHTRTPTSTHTVSFVVPTAGKPEFVAGRTRYPVMHLIRSVLAKPLGTDFEFVVVTQTDSESTWIPEAERLLGDRLRIVQDQYSGFNFSRKVNLGAATATGDMLLFLNDDIEVISPDWLTNMVALAEQDDVGAVGAVMLSDTGRIQHAGHFYSGGNPQHAYYHEFPGEQGVGDLLVDHEVSGVTGACLLQRREIWRQVGGFSEIFPNNFNDVDFCMKITDLGYRIVLCSEARLVHSESLSRDHKVSRKEEGALYSRWGHRLAQDRYIRMFR
jgi:GT2 family glycosyltransferase